LPLKMRAAAYPTELTGVIMAAYFAGLWLGSIYGRYLIGAVGHIRAFAGFAAIVAAAVLAHPLLFHPLVWALLRLVCGFCIAGLFASIESWLNERSANENRGRILSLYMILLYAAIIAGQNLVNLWNVQAVETFMLASLLISLSLVPVALTRIKAPDLSGLAPLSLRELLRASPLGVIGAACSGAMMGGYLGLGAVFAQDLGLSLLQVTLFMNSVILGGLCLQWPIGRLSDRHDRRTVLVFVLMVAGLTCIGGVLAALLGAGLPVFLGLGLLLGGTMTSIYPISTAQAFDYLPRERYVAAASGLLLAYAVGATLGPVVTSFAMGALGNQAFFGVIGTVALSFLIFVLYRMRTRKGLPSEQQEPFVMLPRMSPAGAELDPRSRMETDEPAPESPSDSNDETDERR
ncbi:MAG TPA: MFS transporter, partial [Kiloniellales bacterium]|nr:MFS transporter [Kiloniellales bacterium]